MQKYHLVFVLAGLMSLGNSSLSARNVVKTLENEFLKNSFESTVQPQKRSSSEKRVSPVMPISDSLRPITDVEGTESLYYKASVGTYGFYEEAFFYEGNFASKLIWNDSDEVYFYNILSLADYPTYVRGTISGNEITINLPQSVWFNEEYNYGVNLVALKIHDYKDSWGRDAVEYLLDNSIETVKYTIADDGSLSLIIPGEQYNGEDLPDYALGYVYSDNEEWIGFSDFMQELVPFDGKINEVPENVELKTYNFKYDDYGIIVEVGFDENNLYIKGLNPNMPEGVIIGRIDGDKAYVSQNQVMGIYDNRFMFTKCVYDNPDYDYYEEGSLEFIFAPEDVDYILQLSEDSNMISAFDKDIYLCLNGAIDRLYYLAAYRDLRLKFQDTFAGTPQNPYEPYWFDEFLYGGNGSFFFNITDETAEETLLDAENLYYRIYVDGEIMTFVQEENPAGSRPFYFYPGLYEPTTLIPYNFTNWQDIYLYADTSRRMVEFYDKDMKTVGVQAVYIYEGETTVSDILSYEIATGTSSIIPDPESAVDSLSAADASSLSVFTLQGVKVLESASSHEIKNLSPGTYIINGKKILIRR